MRQQPLVRRPTGVPPSRMEQSSAAVWSLALGVAGVLATIALGLLIVIPLAAIATALVAIHRIRLRDQAGRDVAYAGLALGGAAFVLQALILLTAVLEVIAPGA